jgi:hypothetical protein
LIWIKYNGSEFVYCMKNGEKTGENERGKDRARPEMTGNGKLDFKE